MFGNITVAVTSRATNPADFKGLVTGFRFYAVRIYGHGEQPDELTRLPMDDARRCASCLLLLLQALRWHWQALMGDSDPEGS